MKKTFAGLGVLALVALGATGASFPANAVEVQPVAEIVAQSDAIVASPDAVLVQSEPVVTTTAAEVPAEPVAVFAEPVVAPVAPVETLVITEVIAVVVEAPVAAVVAPEPVVAPVAGSTADTVPADSSELQLGDAWAGAGTHYNTVPVDWDVELAAQCPTTDALNVARWCAHMGFTFPEQLMSSLWDTRTPEQVAEQEARQPAAELFVTPAP